ncbi:NAD(P)-binding oxidoreductase [Gryllotalpicola koreensis]|uniref:NAD(P)-binding domain-containing protein n=1 Tax=Gryllotalpicola koreensis TaxID=993086 RepID=A0ABP7ZY12_9MICO
MKLVVLGANGHVGAHVVTEALLRGHQVVAYVRHPDAVQPRDGLTVVQGSVEDELAMTDAFTGADAVITAIGLRPGAKKPINLMQRALPVITAAAKKAAVGRFVLVSAFGVAETAAMGSPIAKLIFATLVGAIFRDKTLSEKIMPSTGLNWTTVYPVNLKEAPHGPKAVVKPLADVAKVPGIPTLTFATVAATLLDIAADQNMSGLRVLITTDKGWK